MLILLIFYKQRHAKEEVYNWSKVEVDLFILYAGTIHDMSRTLQEPVSIERVISFAIVLSRSV
jgi:hypothetical protein